MFEIVHDWNGFYQKPNLKYVTSPKRGSTGRICDKPEVKGQSWGVLHPLQQPVVWQFYQVVIWPKNPEACLAWVKWPNHFYRYYTKLYPHIIMDVYILHVLKSNCCFTSHLSARDKVNVGLYIRFNSWGCTGTGPHYCHLCRIQPSQRWQPVTC